METDKAIMGRRSIRKFLNKKISYKLLEKLVESARMAPSAMNLQPIEYIIIDDAKLTRALFDLTEWKDYRFKDGPQKGEEPSAYIAILVNNSINSKSALIDAGMASQNLLLSAYNNGIASCCLGAINRKGISNLLTVPENYYLIMVVALGYSKQKGIIVDEDNIKIRSENGIIKVSKRPLGRILHRNKF